MPIKRYLVDSQNLEEDRVTTGGLLAVNVVTTVQLLTLGALDTALYASLVCMSAAIPFLALHFMTLHLDKGRKYSVDPWYTITPAIASWVLSLAALIAAFAHFSSVHGWTFATASILAVAAYLRYKDAVAEVNKVPPEPTTGQPSNAGPTDKSRGDA